MLRQRNWKLEQGEREGYVGPEPGAVGQGVGGAAVDTQYLDKPKTGGPIHANSFY